MRAILVSVFIFAAGCTFDGSLPAGVEFSCMQDSDCPPPTLCQLGRQRCAPREALDLIPPSVIAESVTLRIKPGAGNLITEPAAVTHGSTAEVSFAVSEPLASIALSPVTCTATCLSPAQSGAGYVVSCTLSATPADGTCTLSVVLEDLFGNRSTDVVREFSIDVTPPRAPDAATRGKIVLRREPWGVDAGPARDLITGGPGAVSDAIRVLVRSNTILRAVAVASPSGEFRETLTPLPTADVEVASIDSSGNVSAFASVLDGEWVATMGGKVVGNNVANPHRLEGFSVASDAIERQDAREFGASDGLAAADSLGPRVTGGLRWRRGEFTEGAYFGGSRSAFDPARGKVINYGGSRFTPGPGIGGPDGFAQNTTTSQWVGTGWQQVQPQDPEGDGFPLVNSGHVMVYDPVRRHVILFGGTTSIDTSGQTWAWNGESWRRLADGPPLTGASAFWHTGLSKMVVAGGRRQVAGAALSATWTFDGQRWEQLDAGLPPRAGVPSVYSPIDGAGWMFGGGNDLWRFGRARWEPVDAGSGPAINLRSTLIWHADRKAAWLMGSPQIWEWNGLQWSFVTDGGPVGTAYAYDARRGEIVVISANDSAPFQASMSVMTDAGVQTLGPTPAWPDPSPAVACSHSFGGCVRIANGQVLELKAVGWVPRPTAPPIPVAPNTVMEFDRQGNALMVLAFRDGGAQAHLLSSSGTLARVADPPPGTSAALTRWQDRLLLTSLDWSLAGPTWAQNSSWDGTTWAPQPRFPVDGWLTMAEVPDGGVCVSHLPFFAGSTLAPTITNYFSQLDAGLITLPANSPTAGPMMFDPERQVTYQFGGSLNSAVIPTFMAQVPLGAWAPVGVGVPDGADAPRARLFGAMRFDPVNRRGVLVGGSSQLLSTSHFSDTWLLEAANERPGVVFRIARSAMGVNDETEFTGVSVNAVAGARSEGVDGGESFGVRGALWADGRFKVGAAESTVGSESQPAALTIEVTDSQDLQALLVGQPEVLVGFTPRGINGRGFAVLSTDYVELTVRYRLLPP